MSFQYASHAFDGASSDRALCGAVNHAKGMSAEMQVVQRYVQAGASRLETRWRGPAGEIDLIFRQSEDIVFVEVKSSRTHEQAARQLSQTQINRLLRSAEAYLGTCPAGSLTPMRFDVALVDGSGRIEILENALMQA